MHTSISTTRRLALVGSACLLSVALPMAPAWAQKTKTKPAPTEQAATVAPDAGVSVDIPIIEAVDANVDDATLREILSGKLVENANALAGLTATSITIPTITLNAHSTIDGKPGDSSVTFSDIVLANVVDGVAETVTMTGSTLSTSLDASGEFGAIAANNFDIGGMLRLYGLVDGGGQTELSTLYTDLSFAGGSFTAPDLDCTFGAASAAEFKARPIKSSFAELMALGQALESQGDTPSPQTIGKALHIYVDLFTAFESSPMQFDGFECHSIDADNNPVDISVASMTMGAMGPGTYPSFDVSGLAITAQGDGSITAGNINFKSIDLAAPIAAIQAAPDAIDEDWFMANGRSLIPAFAGFSIDNVSVDIPDPDNPGGRVTGGLGALDVSLANYVNGVPTTFLTTASHLTLDLPANTADEQLQMLMSMGVNSIDAGFTLDANWNKTEKAIAINEISVTGADLASIVLSGTVNNAADALFSSDENTMMAAVMGLAIGKLNLSIQDMGLSDLIMTMVAADQGAEPATLRPVFAGLAEGTIIGALAGAAEAQKVGGAVSAFVAGKAKQLTIDVSAKQPPGLGMIDFMAAQDDPAVLIGKVTIDAAN